MEVKDESNENGVDAHPRKKIERNPSAPLPGMLQVTWCVW